MRRVTRRWASIFWPAFLVAGVLEMAVFAWVDPQSLHTLSGAALSLSPTAIYSIGFLLFWACTSVACALTVLLNHDPERSPEGRHADPVR